MTYIDTDVLIHAYIVQDREKHRRSNEVIEQVDEDNSAAISTLSVQEMLFVLERLRIDSQTIDTAYDEVMQLQPLAAKFLCHRQAGWF